MSLYIEKGSLNSIMHMNETGTDTMCYCVNCNCLRDQIYVRTRNRIEYVCKKCGEKTVVIYSAYKADMAERIRQFYEHNRSKRKSYKAGISRRSYRYTEDDRVRWA